MTLEKLAIYNLTTELALQKLRSSFKPKPNAFYNLQVKTHMLQSDRYHRAANALAKRLDNVTGRLKYRMAGQINRYRQAADLFQKSAEHRAKALEMHAAYKRTGDEDYLNNAIIYHKLADKHFEKAKRIKDHYVDR